jgi:hypothetical protein
MTVRHPRTLEEAVGWSIRILGRLLDLGRLDRWDRATVRAVLEALRLGIARRPREASTTKRRGTCRFRM